MFITQKIVSRSIDRIRRGGVVAHGPFAGAPATEDALHHVWSRLLGVYEFYLHSFVEEAIKAKPAAVVDVGAATGYYTIGLAGRLPKSRHIAFEVADPERASLARTSTRLGVPIETRGFCVPEDLVEITNQAKTGFLVMDCEGGERELLGAKVVEGLRQWTILVEIHDYQAPGVGAEIIERFSATHQIQETWSREPSAADFRFLLPWPLNAWCTKILQNMCDERRGESMQFLFMKPR